MDPLSLSCKRKIHFGFCRKKLKCRRPPSRSCILANSGVTGVPSSYMIDGVQYVAVQSGWGIDAKGMQGRLNAIRPGEFPEVPEGGAVWVFALGE